jgi:hypothetical protein
MVNYGASKAGNVVSVPRVRAAVRGGWNRERVREPGIPQDGVVLWHTCRGDVAYESSDAVGARIRRVHGAVCGVAPRGKSREYWGVYYHLGADSGG